MVLAWFKVSEIPIRSLVRVLPYFLFFRQKAVLRAKISKAVYLQLLINITKYVHDGNHGLILIHRAQHYC